MNTGIQDAVALAARLAGVLRDGADERILDGYEAERRPLAADVVAFTHRLTRVATVDHPGLRRIRNATLRVLDRIPAVRRRIALNLAELAIDRRHGQADDLVGVASATPDDSPQPRGKANRPRGARS